MGCNKAVDTGCFTMEDPYHRVTVPAFRIDQHEVTAAEYKACVTAAGCTPTNTGDEYTYDRPGSESHPVNGVDWDQARAYCAWAGKRLPTEAEWEKAARGADGRRYPWGNDSLDCDHAVLSTKTCSSPGTAPTGSRPRGASPYGALDMSGNVREWVEDSYHRSYTGAPSDGSAWVAPAGESRVVRGGSWSYGPTGFLRTSARRDSDPALRSSATGFRCALSQ